MIKLMIQGIGEGTCSLTGKQGPGLTVAFDDNTVQGFLSWKGFQQLLAMKANGKRSEPKPEPKNSMIEEETE